jgi:hypothetical protein
VTKSSIGIVHAAEAREAFDSGSIESFEHCCSEYTTDPCAKPNDSQDWCDCMFCAMNRGPSEVEMNSRFGTLYGRHADLFRNRKQDYDPVADAVAGVEFDRVWDTGLVKDQSLMKDL